MLQHMVFRHCHPTRAAWSTLTGPGPGGLSWFTAVVQNQATRLPHVLSCVAGNGCMSLPSDRVEHDHADPDLGCVHRMSQRYPAYRDQGLEMIAIFESPSETMRRYVGQQHTPFPIIGHPGNRLYRLYGLEKSWQRLVTTFVPPLSALATIREGFYASFVKGFWPGKIDACIRRMYHRLPRMADFAHWVTAAEPALGWPDGSFMQTYDQTRADVHGIALEASLIAAPLFALLRTTATWRGTARELLERLNASVQEDERKKKEWPKQANALSGQLNRIAPHLRALGLYMDTTREGKARKKVIHLRLGQARKTSSASSASSATGEEQADLGVDQDVLADDGHRQADDHEDLADDHQALADDHAGVADDADDLLHDCSESPGSADAVQQALMWEADV
jgi:hypothetical protein